MVFEAVVTTKRDDRFNIAPMGIKFIGKNTVLISPYNTSHTYVNLRDTGEGVVNFTDNVEIFARSVTSDIIFPWCPAKFIEGWILEDAYMYLEVKVKSFYENQERGYFEAQILDKQERRVPYVFNRARSIVVEAAILVSRLRIYPRGEIERFFSDNEKVILKTGGMREIEAWKYLVSVLRGC